MTDRAGNVLTSLITAVVRHAPEWVRRDLTAKESTVRIRAEETLAAMIADALEKHEG